MVLQVHATANRQRHELRPLVAVRLLTSLLILAFHKTITTRGGGWVIFQSAYPLSICIFRPNSQDVLRTFFKCVPSITMIIHDL